MEIKIFLRDLTEAKQKEILDGFSRVMGAKPDFSKQPVAVLNLKTEG